MSNNSVESNEMDLIDHTHDPARRSWVQSANGHSEFPIQNLPFGVFKQGGRQRGGVAIGDQILDLDAALELGAFSGDVVDIARTASLDRLNKFMAMGKEASTSLRSALSELLSEHNPNAGKLTQALIPQSDASMQLPCDIGDFTDFLTSLPHTDRLGRLKGLAEPVPAAFKSLPVAYHGRSSTIRVNGTPVVRPTGQWRRADGKLVCAPVESLDYEVELGALIGRGNELAVPIPVGQAQQHIFGYCLVNDWSAKGIQWFEQILGPFLGKSFMTSVSPWVVTSQALVPFRSPARVRTDDDPTLFPYLVSEADLASGRLAVELSANLRTAAMREQGAPGRRVNVSDLQCMYWTFAQMLSHHTSNGCSLRAGDLLASGTLSGETPDSMACLSERTAGGTKPLDLGNGEVRGWLLDGDEVVIEGHAHKAGFVSIGFGSCGGVVKPALYKD
ncbi:fumarylacetoacetase [Variovorax sp. OV700]|uniref:fumarylacetoacetase n=1 Tax=Variovorax sp. OV700 TaxID=1882826 RepID=UPI0020C8A520|nr:fumarylacetoacetase [Variovorax sp. OV700]